MSRMMASLALVFGLLSVDLQAQGKLRYEEFALANGLRVFLVEEHSTPVVTVNIWYQVGSRNEPAGRTGMAHLFEHLMFRGSEHVADGQHYQLVEAAGGDASANSTEDRTAFTETLPSNQLALGLWLEADRMRSLKITEQAFTSQREQVKQERQARVDNQPYGAAFLDGLTSAFDSASCLPYSHSVMGSLEQLEAAEVKDAEAFFKQNYVPNRATLVVSGDFDGAEARRLIQAYFEDIPRGAPAPPVTCNVNYAAGARSQEWPDAMATLPAVIVAYRVPAHSDADVRALQLLSAIAGQGESSRLVRALVNEQHVAVQTTAGIETRSGPGLFYAYAIVRQGESRDAAQKALNAQIARLGTDVSQAELDRAKIQYRANATMLRQTTTQLAEEMQHFAHLHGAVEEINTDLDRFAAVTLADLKRAAGKYLVPQNSSTLIVTPAGGAEPATEHQHQEKK